MESLSALRPFNLEDIKSTGEKAPLSSPDPLSHCAYDKLVLCCLTGHKRGPRRPHSLETMSTKLVGTSPSNSATVRRVVELENGEGKRFSLDRGRRTFNEVPSKIGKFVPTSYNREY